METGTGTISVSGSESRLTSVPAKSWTTDEFKGYLLISNTVNPTVLYRITGNDLNAITFSGVDVANSGNSVTYGIKYGRLINEVIATPSSGARNVVFFNNSGENSFANANGTTGICQVCHTRTQSYNNAGDIESINHPDTKTGTNCMLCHKHSGGFKVSGCTSCHGNPPTAPLPARGGPQGLVTVTRGGTGSLSPGAHEKHAVGLNYPCQTCHSSGMSESVPNDRRIQIGFNFFGSYQSGTYISRVLANEYGYEAGNPGTSILNLGTPMTCTNIYCHSNVQGEGGAVLPSAYAAPRWNDPSSVACGSCHKADGAVGSPSLMDSGSHAKHVSTTSYAMACSRCHFGAGQGSSIHVNNTVNVAIDPALSGSYSLGNHSPGQGYGACSNVYCHGNGVNTGTIYKNPAWGDEESGACGTCHGVNAATPPSSGPHAKHVTGYNYSCSKCHSSIVDSNPPDAPNMPSILSPALHVNKSKDVAWDDFSPGGSYNPDSTCAGIYCHSTGTSSTTFSANVTPSWTVAQLDTTCTGCHNGDSAAGNKVNTGSHSKHTVSAGYDCAKCHNETVSASRTIRDPAKHVDKFVNIKFDSLGDADGIATYGGMPSPVSKAPGTAFGACTNIYCHSSVQGEGGTVTGTVFSSPVWGDSASGRCGSCHKADGVQGDNTLMDSGSHDTHVNKTAYDMPCSRCHTGAGEGNPNHADKIINVVIEPAFEGSYSLGNHEPAPGQYGTCTVYCHSDGAGNATPAPAWGSAESVICGSCHGVNAVTPPTSVAHAKHVGDTAGYKYSCSTCHTTVVNATPSSMTVPVLKTPQLHANKQKEIAWSSLNPLGSPYAAGTCANLYCHSIVQTSTGGNLAANTLHYKTPAWNNIPQVQCGSCHKADGGQGDGSIMDSGSHLKHAGADQYKFTCEQCHNLQVPPTASTHVNGGIDTAISTKWGGTYNGDTAPGTAFSTCSNVYCHSIVQTAAGEPLTNTDYRNPTWGGSSLICSDCHGNPPQSGAHLRHAGIDAGRYGFSCDTCHSGRVPPGVITYHVDGNINVPINAQWSGKYNGADDSAIKEPGIGFSYCSNTYCHSNATGGTKNTGGISKSSLLNNINDPRQIAANSSPSWSAPGPLGCTSCHGIGTTNGLPSYPTDSIKANGHPGHKDIACTCCHANTTLDNISVILDSKKHDNGKYDVVPNSQCSTALGTVNFTYSYDPGGGMCSNVSCHGGSAGYWGAPTVGNPGATASLSTSPGSSCFQITATGTPQSSLRGLKPPYTYVFEWGDGSVTGPKTSETIPITESHQYSAAGTANITFHYRDGGQIPASASVIIGVSGTNIDPTASASMSVSGMTLTFTDASFDPDYNTCGHSGNGLINIFWANGVVVNEPIALTDQPSNNVYTYTFANPGTYNLTHAITDNAGKKVNNPMLLAVTVPTNFSVSGKITHAGGSAGYIPGQAFGGVSVEVRKKDGSYVKSASTNADGIYTISNIPESEHYDLVPVKNGFTFSPVRIDIYQSATNVDFVGTP